MANKQDSCTGGGQGTHYFNRWVVDLLHAAPRHLSVSVLTALCWHNPRRRCRRDLDLVVTPGYVLIRHRPTTANSLRSNRPESPTGFLFQHSNRRTFLLLSWFPFFEKSDSKGFASLKFVHRDYVEPCGWLPSRIRIPFSCTIHRFPASGSPPISKGRSLSSNASTSGFDCVRGLRIMIPGYAAGGYVRISEKSRSNVTSARSSALQTLATFGSGSPTIC